MQVACAKGCGVTLDIPQKEVEYAIRNEEPIDFAHTVCPINDPEVPDYKYEYTIGISIVRKELGTDKNPVQLARVRRRVRGDGVALVADRLAAGNEEAWGEVESMFGVMESESLPMSDPGSNVT